MLTVMISEMVRAKVIHGVIFFLKCCLNMTVTGAIY